MVWLGVFQWEGIDELIPAGILMFIDLTETKIINECIDDDNFDGETQNKSQLDSNISSIHYLTSDKFAVIQSTKTEKLLIMVLLKYSQKNIMFPKFLIG